MKKHFRLLITIVLVSVFCLANVSNSCAQNILLKSRWDQSYPYRMSCYRYGSDYQLFTNYTRHPLHR